VQRVRRSPGEGLSKEPSQTGDSDNRITGEFERVNPDRVASTSRPVHRRRSSFTGFATQKSQGEEPSNEPGDSDNRITGEFERVKPDHAVVAAPVRKISSLLNLASMVQTSARRLSNLGVSGESFSTNTQDQPKARRNSSFSAAASSLFQTTSKDPEFSTNEESPPQARRSSLLNTFRSASPRMGSSAGAPFNTMSRFSRSSEKD
jgi:hypothetical protein